jgi:PAS domain S-box-containing protein
MERRENDVLKQRQAATQASLRNLQVILVSGNLFAVGLVVVACYCLSRQLADRQRAAVALEKNHALLHAVIESAYDAIYVKDQTGRYLMTNASAADNIGKPMKEVLGRNDATLFPPDAARQIQESDRRVWESGAPLAFEETHVLNGQQRTFDTLRVPYRDSCGQIIGLIGIAHDITERRLEEMRREALIQQLREALDRIKTLKGLLPICAWCKRIRDDNGYWDKLEAYIEKHSEAEFSHGMCPECAQRLTAEWACATCGQSDEGGSHI